MKLDNIRKIQSLLHDANSLERFHEYYEEEIKPVQNIDKKGYGFNQDTRFAAFTSKVSFDSFKGYYGNSSCYTIMKLNSETAHHHFVEALNALQREIFAEMARSMRVEADSLTAQAEIDIANMQALLEEARKEDES